MLGDVSLSFMMNDILLGSSRLHFMRIDSGSSANSVRIGMIGQATLVGSAAQAGWYLSNLKAIPSDMITI